MRIMVAALLLVLPPVVVPAEGPADPSPTMELAVKPRLCITDRHTPRCEVSFLVTWESDRSGDYCLSNDYVEPLQCWDRQRSGRLLEERVVDREFRYWMSDDDSEDPLADLTVEVLQLDDGDRRRHRRSRHVWSIL